MDIPYPGLRDRRIAASDARTHRRRRLDIRAVILHQTSGPQFLVATPRRPAYPGEPGSDAMVRSAHRIDGIAAHFVVMNDGTVFYTHDVEFMSGSAGAQAGIDIEFAGTFSAAQRVEPIALQAGRRLVETLKLAIPTITHVHPHGQVQRWNMNGAMCGGTTGVRCGKLNSCPGPDIWVNVGEWAVATLGLTSDTTLPQYQNNGISEAQRDRRFDRALP